MINIDYSLLIVILNFVILLVILNKLLYKPINKFLAERKNKIAADLDDAKESKNKAIELVQQKESELKSSAENIRQLKKKARNEAENEASEIIVSAKEHEKKILKETEQQLVYEKKQTVDKIKTELAEMVSSLSAKFLSKKLDEKEDIALIDKMLSERGKK